MDSLFLEVDFVQSIKHGEAICGDSFFVQRIPEENRVIGVLSDGLGSGVKANILSSMTASMAMKFATSNMDFLRAAEVMMDALPICQVRKISYATFTVVDSVLHKWTRIIQMDNPGYFLLRDGDILEIPQREVSSPRWNERKIYFSEILNRPEDRLLLFSDGITQAGMGSRAFPLGWRREDCASFVRSKVQRNPQIAAGELAGIMLREALLKEPRQRAGDDMTCGVLYFRKPRRLILLTGPPFRQERDKEYAALLDSFPGKKVICGGTTSDIIARELDRDITTNLDTCRYGLPPISHMEGVDLITEGILTLTAVRKILESRENISPLSPGARLANLLLESDLIDFVVGTRINEAHQDPSLPMDIEIRRTIVRGLAAILEEKYLKQTRIRFI